MPAHSHISKNGFFSETDPSSIRKGFSKATSDKFTSKIPTGQQDIDKYK